MRDRAMKAGALRRLLAWPPLNFALTNRIPRAPLTRLVGRVSRVRQPLVRDVSIALWRWFADVDLSDAAAPRFASLHDAFTRALRPGARPPDPDPATLASPCDAIVGACGRVERGHAQQIKGSTYALRDLVVDPGLAATYEGGCYATLRLTTGMYHRFHAPHDGTLERVTYVAGDLFNVNPPALQRVPALYCRNERAVLRLRRPDAELITLVPVAAILVASIRLHAIDVVLGLAHPGPNEFDCDVALRKGDEMGWFEHGSTLVLLAPSPFRLADGVETGVRLRVGAALMRREPGAD